MLVYDIAAGPARPLTQLANTGESKFAEFDPTGDTVYWTSLDGTLRRADAHSGQASFSWSAVGAGRPSVAADGRTVLVSDFAMPKAVVLDVGASGDLGGVSTCPGFVPATSLDVGDGLAAFLEVCHGNDTGFAQVIDLGGRSLLASLPGWGAQTLAVSPDGTSFAAQDVEGANGAGPVKVADLRTGSVVTELSGLCSWDGALLDAGTPPEAQPGCRAYPDEPFPIQVDVLRWSPDGTMIAVIDALKGFVAVWGAHDGRLLFRGPTDRSATDVVFSPDSRGLIVAHTTGLVETLSTETWGAEIGTQQDLSVFGVDSLRFVGFLPGGATILAVGGFRGHGGGSLFWLDDGTLKITKTVPDAHIGSVQSAALSPDGSTLATGASDGTLRVWDAASGKIRQQMQFASLVQGLAFIDDRHLAVTPMSGDLLVMVIDPTELANTVRASITRPFTTTECDTYGIDPCPTLEESRAP